MRKLWVVLLLLMVAMVAAACGGGDDEDNGDADSDDTVEAVSLENATTFEATGYTISLPEGWVAEENDFGQLEMYSRAELAEMEAGSDLTEEDAGLIVFPIPADSILPEGESIVSIMGAGGAIGLIPSDVETDAPEEITIDGFDAGRVEVLGVEDTDTIFYGVQVGENIYVLAGLTQAGNLSNFEGTFDALVETVDFAE